jgi:hypothetical protein
VSLSADRTADAEEQDEIVPPETTIAEVTAPAPIVTLSWPLDNMVAVAVVVEIALIAAPSNEIRPCVSPDVAPLAATAIVTAAFAGATDVRTPSPNDATATSATRLKFVFVDMFFLSLVRFRNFLSLARRSFDLLIPLLL